MLAFRCFLVVIPSILVQFFALKNFAYAFSVLLLILFFIEFIFLGRSISRNLIFLVFVYSLFILFQIRFYTFTNLDTYIDLIYLLYGFIFVLSVSTIPELRRDLVYSYIIWLSVPIAIIVIAFHNLGIFPGFFISEPYAGTRWVGGFDGPNEFPHFYLLLLSIYIGIFLEKGKGFSLFLPISMIFLMCFWSGYSRGASFTLLILSAAALPLFLKRFNSVFVLGGVGIFILLIFLNFNYSLNNFNEVRSNTGDRWYIIDSIYSYFFDSPIFGNGIGAYFGAHQRNPSSINQTPHNGYLYFLVSGGIVGFFLYLSFALWVLYSSYKKGLYIEFLFFVTFFSSELTFNNLVRGRISVIFWTVFSIFLISQLRYRPRRLRPVSR